MSQAIKLVGLDCGSTTTSAIVAAARLTKGALGRVEITQVEPVFRSPVVFTPFVEGNIDAARLDCYLDEWLRAAETASEEVFGGGALVTGLAAQQKNAAAIVKLIEARMADSVIATADDPALESWLAFMGNSHALSKGHPITTILNLDIGGGTTNLAWGLNGQVIATACLFVGARHFRFVPGGYQLTGISPYAAELLAHLRIHRGVGETLADHEIDSILDFYLGLIVAAVEHNTAALSTPIAARHVQVMPKPDSTIDPSAVITLSGGVGQLVYERLSGQPCGGTTRFGDLGGELADRIVRAPAITGRMGELVPEGLGRATVYGLLRHATELSGSTLYLPHPERLPLKNIPIVGRFGPYTTEEQLSQLLDLAARSVPAGCLQVELDQPALETLRDLGGRLAKLLVARPLPPERTLVLLVPANVGKVLGNYITRWGTLDVDLIVVDEVPLGDGQFVRLGRTREGVVPLWLYAIR
jgi:ethanolamine utilization protein EutA